MNRIFVIFALLLAFVAQVHAQKEQSFMLTGTVFDEFNEPVPGANVYVKDKPGVGITTNIDGKFRLKVNIYDIVVVSFLGYENYEQRLTNKIDNVKVTLKPATENIDEVVVVGMGTQRKVSVAGAITTMDPAQLEVPATNIVNTLAGRVAGVIGVQSSGEPGKNISEFWVRGIGTFGANSGALVLIDGLEGSLSQIDAADVESFSVLKDAAATAVYGSRGANGVVLVTTKRGLESKLKISGRANMTISHLKRLPEYVNATQYAEMANEASVATGLSPIYNKTEMDIIKYGLDPDLYPNIDWQDVILNPNSFQQTYYVSAQGGSSVARYFASLGMSKESAAYNPSKDSKYNKGVGYDTYNYRLNLDIDLTKTTKVYIGTTGYMSVNTRPSMGEYSRGVSLTDWLWSSQAKTTPISYPLRYSNGYYPAAGTKDEISPYVLLNYTGNAREQNTRNLVTLGITQDLSMITKGLSAKVQGSWDTQSLFGEARYKMPELNEALKERNPNGTLSFEKIADEKTVTYSSAAWVWRKLYLEANVNYDRTFGDHRLGGLLFYYIEDTSETGADKSMNAIPKRYQSLSGRFTYGFKDTYFWDLNFGLNGSENFEPGKQYGFFPAGAFAWVPSSYEFIRENVSWLNFLKLRVSYGVVGNDRISSRRFPYLTLIKEENASNPWGGTGSLTEEQVGANNLMWEKAKKFDVGMDLHLFKDKFTLTLDYFKDTRDGIFQERKQIPDYVGLIQMPYGNIGRMKSWGADGNMEFYQQIGKDAHVILRSNFTLSKNKILNWEDTKKPYTYLENNGYANNVQRGFVAMGLFKDQQDVEMSPTQFGTVRPGDIKYRDINGDGMIDTYDQVVVGNTNPHWIGGFNTTLRWKNFQLYGRFDFAFDYWIYDNTTPWFLGCMQGTYNTTKEVFNTWSEENPNAKYPRMYGQNPTVGSNYGRKTDKYLSNAAYFRIKNVTLSYTVPKTWISRIGLNQLKGFVSVENLATFSSLPSGIDPETLSWNYPAFRTVSFGINFTL